MLGRCRISIRREGWYYLFVVTFIIGGAVLREVNLLVVLAGMMVGPLLLNWRLVGAMLNQLDVRRRLPKHAFAGQPISIEVQVVNNRRRLASWALVLQDRIRLEGKGRRREATRVDLYLPRVGPGQTTRTTYECQIDRRGLYRLHSLAISTRFPLGLLQATRADRKTEELCVGPRLGNLTRHSIRWLESEKSGTMSSRHRRGISEGDYYGLREWCAGDTTRWIHWRTTAKLGELAVRQFEQHRNRDLVLVVDLWQDQQPDARGQGLVELALSIAATVIYHQCRLGGADLIVAVAGDEDLFWSGPTSEGLFLDIHQKMATLRASADNPLSEVLTRVVQQAHVGMKTLVISTRCSQLEQLSPNDVQATGTATNDGTRVVAADHAQLAGAKWLDVGADEIESYFQLPDVRRASSTSSASEARQQMAGAAKVPAPAGREPQPAAADHRRRQP